MFHQVVLCIRQHMDQLSAYKNESRHIYEIIYFGNCLNFSRLTLGSEPVSQPSMRALVDSPAGRAATMRRAREAAKSAFFFVNHIQENVFSHVVLFSNQSVQGPLDSSRRY
jgi:hypothetical protein